MSSDPLTESAMARLKTVPLTPPPTCDHTPLTNRARLLKGWPLTEEKEPPMYKTRPRRASALTDPLESTEPMLYHSFPFQPARPRVFPTPPFRGDPA